jgi:GTPase
MKVMVKVYIYAIGFLDDGSALGITKCELKMTLHNIVLASKEIGANITKFLIFINNNSYWAKIFINRLNIV